ncbi:MAG: hypothetical protein ABSG32_32005 [Terriglobia bacterium]|jgi:hypothetical protein
MIKLTKLFFLGTCFYLVTAFPAIAQSPTQGEPLNILFTGRRFGYFRMPPVQSGKKGETDDGCPKSLPLSDLGQHLRDSVEPYNFQERL